MQCVGVCAVCSLSPSLLNGLHLCDGVGELLVGVVHLLLVLFLCDVRVELCERVSLSGVVELLGGECFCEVRVLGKGLEP